ncbi:hypothetical protein GDO86_017121 [Hymenochirus boettgeri]|uniref:Uncharacterized protein n=1 Tax=Hymenochirus boettgeri TaxID=247094 RepID=A0A8T2IMD9_9PIPI|nr:hypothetical protein GDO86_017121 [Hymenochirus boettgeri]
MPVGKAHKACDQKYCTLKRPGTHLFFVLLNFHSCAVTQVTHLALTIDCIIFSIFINISGISQYAFSVMVKANLYIQHCQSNNFRLTLELSTIKVFICVVRKLERA